MSAGGHAVFKAVADFGQVRRESRQTERSLKSLDRAGNSTSGRMSGFFGGLGKGAGALVGFTGKIAVALPLIFSMAGALLAATGGSLALAGSLSAVAGLAVVIPGILAGMAMAGLSVALAMKDAKTQLGGLLPDLQKLQKSVSGAFWQQAKKPIEDMAHTLLPMLSSGLTGLGKSMGSMTADLATSLKKHLTGPILKQMFDATGKGIENARKGIDPLVHALTTVGLTGAKYLPALGTHFADMMKKFDAFIQTADKDGSLKRWADGGIRVLKELWSVVKSAMSILKSLFDAAQKASPPDALLFLTGALKDFADVLKRPEVQKGLTAVFKSAYDGMASFKDGLKQLGPALSGLGPALGNGLERSGQILGMIAGFIATIVSQPAFKSGLAYLFDQLAFAFANLQPAMKPIGDMLGHLAPLLGDIAQGAGDILGSGLATLAPILSALFDAVRPLIKPLADFIKDGIKALGPPMLVLAKDVLPQLVPLMAQLLPLLAELVIAAAPVVTEYFKQLAKSLKEINANGGAKDVIASITASVRELNGLPKAFAALSFGDQKTGLQGIMQFAVDHPEVAGFFTALFTALNPGGDLTDKIIAVAAAFQGLGTALNGLSDGTGIGAVAGFVTGAVTNFDTLFGYTDKWNGFWGGLAGTVQANFPVITAAVSIGFGSLGPLFTLFQITTGVGWQSFWTTMPTPVTLAMSIMNGSFFNGLQGMAGKALLGVSLIAVNIATGARSWALNTVIAVAAMAQGFVTGFWNLIRQVPGLVASIGFGLQMAFPGVRGIVANWPFELAQNLMNGIGQLYDSGAALVGSFARGITSGTNLAMQAALAVAAAVSGAFPHSPAKYGPFSGKGWTPYRGIALVEGFGEGMGKRTGYLKKQAAAAMSAAALDGQGSLSLEARLKHTMALPGGGPAGLGDFVSPTGSAAVATTQGGASYLIDKVEINNPKPERATTSLPNAIRAVAKVGV